MHTSLPSLQPKSGTPCREPTRMQSPLSAGTLSRGKGGAGLLDNPTATGWFLQNLGRSRSVSAKAYVAGNMQCLIPPPPSLPWKKRQRNRRSINDHPSKGRQAPAAQVLCTTGKQELAVTPTSGAATAAPSTPKLSTGTPKSQTPLQETLQEPRPGRRARLAPAAPESPCTARGGYLSGRRDPLPESVPSSPKRRSPQARAAGGGRGGGRHEAASHGRRG